VAPRARKAQAELRLVLLRDGSVVADHVRRAGTMWARLKGLLGTTELPAGHCLAFRRASTIHTVGMRYPIDVVFCDRDLAVLKVVSDLDPTRLAAARGARWTFELPAGGAAGLRRGDRLALVE
jgi:uncharacterized membrane protein (UPF0127 family)